MLEELQGWASRNGVAPVALYELVQILSEPPPAPAKPAGARSEGAIQAEIRLEAPRWGGVLWRNNVGCLKDVSGQPVRYGLANDSSKLNKKVKSSDLIGFTPAAGRAVFTAIECKREAWVWTGNPHEIAQQQFHNIVKASGGLAGFARNLEEFQSIISGAA